MANAPYNLAHWSLRHYDEQSWLGTDRVHVRSSKRCWRNRFACKVCGIPALSILVMTADSIEAFGRMRV